ncbi:MAG TPA: zinc ABC transporter substrate-binding protein [Anaerolineales bacterium]|nr:zinc ABC transporter substrate-binding protein [Anaerolineales bacterium]
MLRDRRINFWNLIVAMLSLALALPACSGAGPAPENNAGTISVVAAENFYGDIVQQLGAGHVSVVSILSDPNVDPHEYESSVQDGVAISKAQLVIENGADYDTWMDKLLAASPDPHRIVLTAANVSSNPLPDNPHVWYGLDNIQTIAQNITADLETLDGTHKADYDAALTKFQKSLEPIQQKMNEIKNKYAGTPVGLTETIFLYQTQPIGLNVLTPFEFEKAIAEGNDPPAGTVVTANNQIIDREIKVLIYNVQTETPITTNLQNEAKENNIPIVPVSETMPAGKTYQSWMLDQLDFLEQALGG